MRCFDRCEIGSKVRDRIDAGLSATAIFGTIFVPGTIIPGGTKSSRLLLKYSAPGTVLSSAAFGLHAYLKAYK